MTKSHVSLEQKVCVVCGKSFDTGSILFDTKLRETFEHETVTGWGLCPDDAAKKAEGYVALIGIDPAKSAIGAGGAALKAQDAYRNGKVIHIREQVWGQVFDVPVPPEGVCFVEPGVIDLLVGMVAPPTPSETNSPELRT